MKSVGIKLLKDKLSSYLKLVQAGEVILVTDHDEVVAEIRKPRLFDVTSRSKLEAFNRDAIGQGEILESIGGNRIVATAPRLPVSANIDISALIDESRRDRYE